MTERYPQFLVDLSGKSPRNLKDSIRHVQNASAGFTQSWTNGEFQEALETSQEAFEHFDYILNELIRQRDVLKANQATWPTSLFKAELSNTVGQLHNNVTYIQQAWFLGLTQSAGAMPADATLVPLTLDKALNKLKHRDTVGINFSLSASGRHILYFFTKAGMGQPISISEIDVFNFCAACKSAAKHI